LHFNSTLWGNAISDSLLAKDGKPSPAQKTIIRYVESDSS
jgi:hypothetical protein